jgi:hypothetical protein
VHPACRRWFLSVPIVLVLAHSPTVMAGKIDAAAAQTGPCGLSPSDWCPGPSADPCSRHANERSCRADPRCVGMPYRGESVIACLSDGRGFWSNCPAVGCLSSGR